VVSILPFNSFRKKQIHSDCSGDERSHTNVQVLPDTTKNQYCNLQYLVNWENFPVSGVYCFAVPEFNPGIICTPVQPENKKKNSEEFY
jgi:hypothetical protein